VNGLGDLLAHHGPIIWGARANKGLFYENLEHQNM
jgi:hypothetical protein